MYQKLIESISLQLKDIFHDAIIYSDFVYQNFKQNSFYIKILESYEKPCISNRFKLFNKVELIYTPMENKLNTPYLNNINSKLFQNMKKLKFENRYILAENIHSKIVDNKLLFYLEFNFYVFKSKNYEKMKNLFIGDTQNAKTKIF